MESQQIIEKLVEFRSIHESVIEACDKIIEEVLPWTPREYGFADSKLLNEKPGAKGHLIEPGAAVYIAFGVEHAIPGTELFGVPSTVQLRYGVEHSFRGSHLIIDDESAKHFDVNQVFFGNRASWGMGAVVPAARFTELSLPWPELNSEAIGPGVMISVDVVNKTTEPQLFRAKIVGKELILPWAQTANA